MRNVVLAALVLAPFAPAQERGQPTPIAHFIVPQTRSYRMVRQDQAVIITGVKAHVTLLEQAATTTLEIALRNPNNRAINAVLLLPVPDGAAVHAFAYDGPAREPTAKILPKHEARRIYDSIVRRSRDPALLEFAGFRVLRSSVFPVPANGVQKVRISYHHLASRTGNRVDYVLPRSESLDVKVPWTITVDIKAKAPISTVYSPSHDLVQKRHEKRHISLTIRQSDPGPFRISYLVERNGVNATLYAYPDPKVGGGYFLLLAGVPAKAPRGVRREVTVVIDRSGSMAGKKMDQAKAAALQVLEGLADGEAFNIIDYATTVERFAAKPVIKTRETILKARAYLASLRPTGGTNIHDALVEALRQEPIEGMLPIVLFLTDGLPTIGNTAERSIREAVKKGNPHNRRLFTFGVGNDVNVPLLDRVAEMTRATSTYVLPTEDIEVKIGQVFRRLYGPVLSHITLASANRMRELMPHAPPDLFEGDQLVLLGQYRGDEPLDVSLKGRFLGKHREFRFAFTLKNATTRNAFVPRLWATRRISFLVDQLRQAGASDRPAVQGQTIFSDPRYKELADEILRLSTEFGVLTEYTSFLAREGTNLADWDRLATICGDEINNRAVKNRSGQWAVAQGRNIDLAKKSKHVQNRLFYLDRKLNRVEITGVQQVGNTAYFKRGTLWIQGDLVSGRLKLAPDVTVRYGTPEYEKILTALIRQGRQGAIARKGDILIRLQGRNVLVQNRFSGK